MRFEGGISMSTDYMIGKPKNSITFVFIRVIQLLMPF